MKKLFASIVMLVAACTATFAQQPAGTITLQPKVGMTIANLTKLDDADSRIGFVGGAELEYQATDIFSVSAGVLYSMQGAKYSGSYDRAKYDVTAKLDYINIPILANVYVVKGLAVKLGIQPAFNVNAKASASTNIADLKGSTDIDAKSFDFSIPVGLSYEYSNVVLDARYNWGLTKVADNSDSKNSVFQITLGYKFAL